MSEVFWLAFLSLSGVAAFAIGIPCLSVGVATTKTFTNPFLTSVPLCPIQGGFSLSYVGSALTSDICAPSNSTISLDVPIPDDPPSKLRPVLIHNLWDYNFTLELRDHENRVQYSSSQSRIWNSSDPSTNPDISASPLSDLPDSLRIGKRVLIHCPSVPTLITQWLGIEPFCNEPSGVPAAPPGVFERLELAEFEASAFSESTLTVVFNNLSVSPKDFVTPPQLYWVSWGKTNRLGLVISGGVFTALGGILTVCTILFILGFA
jgi:hypothetical protein